MSDPYLSAELIERIRARAADPARRSDRASLAAHNVPMEAMLASLPPCPDAALQKRVDKAFGMMSRMMGMFGGRAPMISTMVGDSGGEIVSIGGRAKVPPLPARCDERRIAAAETELGFALPPALRQLYLEVADGGFGPGEGLYGLDALLAKWREMNREPIAPGEDWPAHLLPIAGPQFDLACLDRDGRGIVALEAEWDVAEGSADPDDPDYEWHFSFAPEADSLEAWLIRWLDRPTEAEAIRALPAAPEDWVAGFVQSEREARILQWYRDHPEVEPPPGFEP